MAVAARIRTIQHQAMLTRIYVSALLVDEDLADQVWDLWDRGVIDDELVSIAWMLIAAIYSTT